MDEEIKQIRLLCRPLNKQFQLAPARSVPSVLVLCCAPRTLKCAMKLHLRVPRLCPNLRAARRLRQVPAWAELAF